MRAPAQSPERAAGPESAALSGLALAPTANPGLAPWATVLTPLRGVGQQPRQPVAAPKGRQVSIPTYIVRRMADCASVGVPSIPPETTAYGDVPLEHRRISIPALS